MGARIARLLLVVLMALASCGCTRGDDVIELTQWTLVTPSRARHEVTIPGRFTREDTGPDSHVELEALVDVRPQWRGGPVTFVVPLCLGRAALDVDGVEIAARRTGSAYAWQLGPAAARSPTLRLRLVLDLGPAPVLSLAPRLSSTRDGDSRYLAVAAFNFDSAIAGGVTICLFSALYLCLFLLDRSRVAHGWFALQAVASLPIAAYPAWLPGAQSWLFAITALANSTSHACGARFYRVYFGLPRIPRLIAACIGAGVIVDTMALFPTTLPSAMTAFVLKDELVLILMIAWLMREARRGVDRFAAKSFLVCWVVVAVIGGPDGFAHTGAAIPALGGLLGVPTGIVLFALGQSLVLGRDHIRSLREAEARLRDVEQLNVELRRQVAERSRELTDALARTEGSVSPAALDVGDVFDGRYRVTRSLGRGGMGAVYEVERTRDGKRLALKVVTAALQAKQAARFAREAEIGARLQHENLVSIVDVGIAVGVTPFLVMELVQGGSLEDKRARFGDAAWARPIVRQIAAGLAELHANHVVHRDLKPGNVLLVENLGGSNPLAKISDFGISRFGALDDSADVDADGATVTAGARQASPRDLTETGAIMGTPVYMPPEAWFGPARHPSADVFSLGVLAYETLTGRSPFAVPPVLLVRARQPIPTPAPLDGVDIRVASVVLACLRVEPSERPRARELVESLS